MTNPLAWILLALGVIAVLATVVEEWRIRRPRGTRARLQRITEEYAVETRRRSIADEGAEAHRQAFPAAPPDDGRKGDAS